MSVKENIVKHYIRRQRINPDYNADLEQPLDQFLRIHSLLGNGTLVILLDQFEEFFYYHRFSEQRLLFIQELAAAIRDTQSPTVFVFSMREDFAMEMEAFKTWLPGIFDNIYRIEKLSLEAAEKAITSPVAAFKFAYQPELIKKLLEDLGERERQERLDIKPTEQQQEAPLLVEPPHLQIVCQGLWLYGNTAQDRIITTNHYNDLGCAKGILDRYFKRKMARLNAQQQRLASRAFDHLVSQHGAKMPYPLEDLAKLLDEDQAALQQTLNLLQSAAILRRLQRQGRLWYELYHDIFAKSIVAWNQDYKNRHMLKRFALWAASHVIAGIKYFIIFFPILFVSYDSWENYSRRHLRLGEETVSDRVELYQGESGSRDLFKQQGFIFETDYQRQAIEADKRFKTAAIAELNQDRQMQIGQLKLKDRYLEYANVGLLDSADKVAAAMREDDELINSLFQGLSEIRLQQSIDLLDKLYQENPKQAVGIAQALGKLKAEAAAPGLLSLLKDNDFTVSNSAADALGNLNAEAAIPGLLPLLKDNDSDVRSSASEVLGNLKAEAAVPGLLQLLKDNDADLRLSAARSLGIMKAKTAIPKLLKLLENDADSGMQQAAALALSRINAKTDVLTQWQDKQLNELAEKINIGSTDERSENVTALGTIHNEAAVTLLVGLLKDKDTDVVNNAIESLGNIGEYHPEWLQPFTQQLLQLTANPDTDIQTTAITILGQLIAFNGETKTTIFVEFEKAIIEHLIAITKNSKQKNLRFTALDALGSSANPQAAAALLLLLKEEELASLHFSITYWLGHIAYKPAQELLEARLKELEQDKQQWRKQRDDKPADAEPHQATTTQAKEDKSRQYEIQSYQIAYAIARIAPETDVITLLEHPLYAVRQAAIQALADRADGKLIKQLLEYHQTFDPADLPSPRPYDTYRALDKALYKVEVSGNESDLELLKKLKGKHITTAMKTQERAINERFDWTITELDQRLKTTNSP